MPADCNQTNERHRMMGTSSKVIPLPVDRETSVHNVVEKSRENEDGKPLGMTTPAASLGRMQSSLEETPDGEFAPIEMWQQLDELVLHVLSYFNVPTLVGKKQVNKKWQHLCAMAIDNKCPEPKAFETSGKLHTAVTRYCGNKSGDIEELAHTYGYPIGKWNVSKVDSLDQLFSDQENFNEDIEDWDVSNVYKTELMFRGAKSFNKPLNKWKTSKIKNMFGMFFGASSFNQPLHKWDTSKVRNMDCMFKDSDSFNQDINSWDVSKVVGMMCMFDCARSFNKPLFKWDTRGVTHMAWMFKNATSFNQSLDTWDVSKVKDMSAMFYGATSFKQLINWKTHRQPLDDYDDDEWY